MPPHASLIFPSSFSILSRFIARNGRWDISKQQQWSGAFIYNIYCIYVNNRLSRRECERRTGLCPCGPPSTMDESKKEIDILLLLLPPPLFLAVGWWRRGVERSSDDAQYSRRRRFFFFFFFSGLSIIPPPPPPARRRYHTHTHTQTTKMASPSLSRVCATFQRFSWKMDRRIGPDRSTFSSSSSVCVLLTPPFYFMGF